jgi:hypothetical protein
MIGVRADRLYWRISLAVSKPSMSNDDVGSPRTRFEDLLQRSRGAGADQLVAGSSSTISKTRAFRVVDDEDWRSPSSAEVVEFRVQQHSQP